MQKYYGLELLCQPQNFYFFVVVLVLMAST